MSTPVPLALVLEQHLSPERLGPYRRATGGALSEALRLYRWNAAVSGALFEDLGVLEVVLRNALDARLTLWHTARHAAGEWWDDPDGVLAPERHDDIADAVARVRRSPVTRGRVLAELNFGFWRYLLAGRYEHTLWTPALRLAFPHLRPARRADVGDRVDALNRLRNRIAHHEPVHGQALAARHDDLLAVVGAISPPVREWLGRTSRVPGILSLRPAPGTRPAWAAGGGQRQ